jgi:carboxylesterase
MPFQPNYEVPEERRAYHFPGQQRTGWEHIGCLVLHGFMGSPISSRPMAQHLATKGITMLCPLLPGHGNLPYQIHKHSKQEWIAEAEEAFDLLSQQCDQVFLIGHSMGAVLAAHLANKHRDVCGLILLAPLYDVPDWRIKLAFAGKYFMPWFYPLKRDDVDRDIFVGRVTDFDPLIDVDDPALQDWLVEATRISLSSTDEMRKMADMGRKLWPKIHQPAIFFQGGNDPAVNPGNTEKLFQKLRSPDKEMKFFPQVGHELMRPVEPIHTKVWHKTYEFIEEHVEIGQKTPTPLNAPSLLVQKNDDLSKS